MKAWTKGEEVVRRRGEECGVARDVLELDRPYAATHIVPPEPRRQRLPIAEFGELEMLKEGGSKVGMHRSRGESRRQSVHWVEMRRNEPREPRMLLQSGHSELEKGISRPSERGKKAQPEPCSTARRTKAAMAKRAAESEHCLAMQGASRKVVEREDKGRKVEWRRASENSIDSH